MGEFHQHPDGHIIVIGDAGTYVDSRANFETDFGTNLAGAPMPDGADDHIYTQDKRHCFMGGGNVIAGGPMPWPEGDQIIAAVEAGLAAQAARQPPPPEGLPSAQGQPSPVDVFFDFENRLRRLEGESPLDRAEFEQRLFPSAK
jgi:hypothetical protein